MKFVNQDFEQIIPHLYRYALTCIKSDVDAKDLVQDVCERMLRSEFDGDKDNLENWRIKILRNLYIDKCRKKRRLIFVEDMTIFENYFVVKGVDSDLEDVSQCLLNILKSKSKKCSDVILLLLQGFEYKEIVEVLNLKMNTVKTRIYRARKLMNEYCGDYLKLL